MTAEPDRIILRLTGDARLMPAVVRAVESFAERIGFGAAASRSLGEAAEQACNDSFAQMDDTGGEVGVIVEDFADRIEITVEHKGDAGPAAGLDTFGGFSGAGGAGLALLARVDRVQYQTENGVSRMKLIKYVSSAKPK